MFEDPGKKLKKLATALFVLELIAIFIYIIVFAGTISHNRFDLSIFIGCFIAFIILAFCAWVSALLIHVFGDISENTKEQIELLKEINEKLGNKQE